MKKLNDELFKPLSEKDLSKIYAGQDGGDAHTISSMADGDDDCTYVTTNTDQVFHGDGLDKGQSTIYDQSDLGG